MAPSWISTTKLSQKAPSPRPKKRFTSSMWPVEETGKNSVMPSTMPRMTARNESDSMIKRPLSRLVYLHDGDPFCDRHAHLVAKKAGFFSLIRSDAATGKNRKTLVEVI